uniref:cellulase n=1 Tax=Timema genevievae TaxID=629358 RepID=A0A7R9PMU5_TIMGE|nr:unnamed protein product [Timema genevievae]
MKLYIYILFLATYDYKDVLEKSLLFYEAQRSGKLPSDQKVTWRKDSALNDKGNNGEDLTGGYYDAGDYVKFGFPMAFTTTVLSWGLLDHENGYQKANSVDDCRKAIKWATDWFLKAHVSANEYYGQVGSGTVDHASWGRPEDMTMERPAFKITTSAPGSDLAAETAAALAAASLVFQSVDSTYAATLLEHAKQLYDFGYNYRGLFSDSITDSQCCYTSTHYEDELVWGAAWLYRATNDQKYLVYVDELYSTVQSMYGFDWDQKFAGAMTMLYKVTKDEKYATDVKNYCDYVINSSSRTPKGLIFIYDWGPARYAANLAFIFMQEKSPHGKNPTWKNTHMEKKHMEKYPNGKKTTWKNTHTEKHPHGKMLTRKNAHKEKCSQGNKPTRKKHTRKNAHMEKCP